MGHKIFFELAPEIKVETVTEKGKNPIITMTCCDKYTIALRFNLPAYMLKLVSSVIVIIAISGPYFKQRFPEWRRIREAGGNRHA